MEQWQGKFTKPGEPGSFDEILIKCKTIIFAHPKCATNSSIGKFLQNASRVQYPNTNNPHANTFSKIYALLCEKCSFARDAHAAGSLQRL